MKTVLAGLLREGPDGCCPLHSCPMCALRATPASWGTGLALAALPRDGHCRWEAALKTPHCGHPGKLL